MEAILKFGKIQLSDCGFIVKQDLPIRIKLLDDVVDPVFFVKLNKQMRIKLDRDLFVIPKLLTNEPTLDIEIMVEDKKYGTRIYKSDPINLQSAVTFGTEIGLAYPASLNAFDKRLQIQSEQILELLQTVKKLTERIEILEEGGNII